MKRYDNPQVLSGFIQRIYQATLAPNEIHQLIDDVRSHIEAPYGAFQIEDMQTHELGDCHLINYDDSAINSYAEHFVSKDPWTIKRLENNHLNTMFDSGHKHIRDKDYVKTEFYQDWGRHNGVRHAIGCSFDINDQHMVKVSFQRHDDQTHFNDDCEYFLNLLQPHISRFVQLSSIFQEHQQNNMANMLLALNRPVWVVTDKLDIIFHNDEAQLWMSNGKHLTSAHDKLLTPCHQQQALLHKHIKRVTETPHNPERWLNQYKAYDQIALGENGYQENFWITPLPSCKDPSTSVALITGRKPLPKVDLLSRIHGLSQRKAQLCLLLMDGYSSQDAAQHLNISINTVRNLLASCFKSLKVNSQTELVQRLFNTSCITLN